MAAIVKSNENLDPKEKQQYVDYLEKKYNRRVEEININIDGDTGYVNLSYKFERVGFERIRRITGYLVGTVDKWNDAKKSEEHDRVKHEVVDRIEHI